MAGLLGDIYSYGDTLKRKVKGLLADPVGTVSQMAGQFNDDMNAQIGNMRSGYGFDGGKSVLASPEQQAAARRSLADYGANMGIAGATVWHGSPHKFDKFDSSKIGTGEGAQAYGHGLYLAEAQDTAQSYANKLTNVDGRAISDQIDGRVRYLNMLKQQARDGDINAAKNIPVMEKSLAELQNQGSLYKVDLPDEHIAKMLDWDKPLSQQHPDVQKMLEPLGYSTKAQVGQYDDDLLAALNGSSHAPLQQIRDPMGSDIARGGGLFDGKDQIEKAKRLKELGIPGIRYLDGGSRGAGQGSSNFVVFPGNEGLLSIMERNGQPIGGLLK